MRPLVCGQPAAFPDGVAGRVDGELQEERGDDAAAPMVGGLITLTLLPLLVLPAHYSWFARHKPESNSTEPRKGAWRGQEYAHRVCSAAYW